MDMAPVGPAPSSAALARHAQDHPQSGGQRAHPSAVAANAATQTHLSNALRALQSVLDALPISGLTSVPAAPGQSAAPLAAQLSLPQPLFDPASAKSASPQELGVRVQQALEASGAFYEAHQERWLRGELPLDALRREPQARLPAETANVLALARNHHDVAPSGERGAATASELTGSVARNEGTSSAPRLQVPPALLPALEQQLHFLASGELIWRGEAWPGQQMQWRLAHEQGGGHEAERARAWQTTLRLSLPQLGQVEAQLQIVAGQLSLRLKSEAHARPRLAEAVPELALALESAGVKLKNARVQPHE